MNQEKPQREFFENEIILKLYKGFNRSDYENRISFVKEQAEKVREFPEADIFEKNLNSFITHCYLDAEKHTEAIPYLKKEVDLSTPEKDQFYFLPIGLLIRSFRKTGEFSRAFKWNEKAIGLFEHASSFDKLNVLKEYAKLIRDSGEAFNWAYKAIIKELIDDLGFTEKLEDPIETIYSIDNTHRIWNKKLGEIVLK